MGRWAGVRLPCSLNIGKDRRGTQPDGQARSLTQRLVSILWACQHTRDGVGASLCIPVYEIRTSLTPPPAVQGANLSRADRGSCIGRNVAVRLNA